jgi:hypothetical protein
MKMSKPLSEKFSSVFGSEISSKIARLEYPQGDFLDFGVSDPNKISYIPKNALSHVGDKVWHAPVRQEKGLFIKVSKLLTLAGVPNPEVSKLTAKWSAKSVAVRYEEMDIEDLYTLAEKSGLSSCMTPYAYDVANFYNAAGATGAAFFIGDELVGRALLWNEVHFGDGTVGMYLDRIYSRSSAGSNIVVDEAIRDLADANGWRTRLIGECYVQTPELNPDDYFYPYLDSFYYVSECFTRLSNVYSRYHSQSTDGTLEGRGVVCDECGDRCRTDDAVIIDENTYCCDSCANRAGYIYVEHKDRLSNRAVYDWVYADEYTYIDSLGIYLHNDITKLCERCDNEYIPENENYCETCQEEIDKEAEENEEEAV